MLDNELTKRLQPAEVGELLVELIRTTTRGDRASGRCLCRLLNHSRKVKGGKDTSVCRTSWEGRQDASVCRTSWEGWQAETRTHHTRDPERAPAELHLHQLRFSYGDSAGARLELLWRGVLFSACHPSQLVQYTEASWPLPACSGPR